MKGKVNGLQNSLLHWSQTKFAKEALNKLRLACSDETRVTPTLTKAAFDKTIGLLISHEVDPKGFKVIELFTPRCYRRVYKLYVLRYTVEYPACDSMCCIWFVQNALQQKRGLALFARNHLTLTSSNYFSLVCCTSGHGIWEKNHSSRISAIATKVEGNQVSQSRLMVDYRQLLAMSPWDLVYIQQYRGVGPTVATSVFMMQLPHTETVCFVWNSTMRASWYPKALDAQSDKDERRRALKKNQSWFTWSINFRTFNSSIRVDCQFSPMR